jgi:DNA-binding NarL/FixJ family response regulator
MIRVALAEDETLVRQGIRGLLALVGDIAVVAEAADGDQALEAVASSGPDVLLLDVRMPKRTGIDVLVELGRRGTLPPTILLTTFDDDETLLKGMRAGAKGFLLKDVSIERLAEAIRLVARGETLIRPAITERVLKAVDRARPGFDALDRPDRLTRRETEILRMMAGGFSNREIAEALGASEGTIKNHASSVFSKLGVRDRTRAVLKGIELGWI